MTRAAIFFAAVRDLILGTAGNRMTNWNEGGPIRSVTEATGYQLEAESFRADTMYRNLFGLTAGGTDLDLRAAEQGLKRKPAWKARGFVQFTQSESGGSPVTVPAGTRVATADPRSESDAVEFVTLNEEVVSAGSRVEIECEAVVAGDRGNVAAGQVDVAVDPPTLTITVVNPAAISGGADLETDADLRARLALAPYRCAIGQPARTWESLAQDVVGVAKATCVSCWAGPNTFKILVWSRDGEGALVPASAALVTAVDTLLQTYVIAGVELITAAATGISQDVTVYLSTTGTFETVAAQVKTAIEGLFPTAELVVAAIVQASMDVTEVTDVRVALPTANVELAGGAPIYAGAVRVLPMEWDGHYL